MKTTRPLPPLPRFFPALAVLFVFDVSAHAADNVSVSLSTEKPSGNIILSYTPGAYTGYSWNANSDTTPTQAWRDVGQTFTTTQDFSLASISLRANLSNGSNSPALDTSFTLTVYSFSGIYSNAPAATPAQALGSPPPPPLTRGNQESRIKA
ncbi:MAG: hypothetical protein LBK99_13400 [Opitutaceae bacterium]|jgi:hypothetical protein|nr:hypothetical protein [Opitutaceae bacterium]